MALTKEDVQHIASLARIELSEEEIGRLQKELSSILAYFEQLQELDTENVEPIGHITGMQNIYRADKVEDFGSKGKDTILKNAPQTKDGYFKVKSVM